MLYITSKNTTTIADFGGFGGDEIANCRMDLTHAGSSEPVADGPTANSPLPSSLDTGELSTLLKHITRNGIEKCILILTTAMATL